MTSLLNDQGRCYNCLIGYCKLCVGKTAGCGCSHLSDNTMLGGKSKDLSGALSEALRPQEQEPEAGTLLTKPLVTLPEPDPDEDGLPDWAVDAMPEGQRRGSAGKQNINDEAIVDPAKTGRKRANRIKPITKGVTVCEWAYNGAAGNGNVAGLLPIIPCGGKFATNVHHGPDKNPLNNDPDNLHRICSQCHNRWHLANDPFYE